MSFTANQKSQLAKLMATENLSVEHQKIRTAAFDPQSRVLYLPIWQNMSGDLYDLLTGHEVGHALYTPADGWHNVVKDKTNKNLKSFINVVEDARIEKKIKRKYPGLNRSFKSAYQDLMDRDFFGLRGRDINTMAFINRLNLYTKSQYTMDIHFTAEEQVFVDRVKSIESWDEVMSLSKDIYDYSKSEQFEMMELSMFQQSANPEQFDDESFDDYDTSDAEDSDDQPEGEPEESDSAKGQNSEKQDDAEETKSESEQLGGDEGENGEDKVESDENGTSVNRDKDSVESEFDQFDPSCETDDHFRANEDSLLDMKCREYVYVDIPTVDLTKVVTPAARVQELLSEYYDERIGADQYGQFSIKPEFVTKLVSEFKSRNERYVGLLAKEFEMKKAAKSFSKAKVSDTGDIDVGKLATYRFNDNIFRKVMHVPKGKSHGLQLLLDCSGSMSRNMPGSIEQILILAMFCRKVNIPFEVYGFSDDHEVYTIDHKVDKYGQAPMPFSRNLGEMDMSMVQLRQYLHSRMNNAEFNRAMRNMLLLKQSYVGGRWDPARIGRPRSECLTNTPLTQAIIAMAPIMNNFRKVNNIDLTNLVVVHDGDSDNVHGYFRKVKDYNNNEFVGSRHFDTNNQNVFLRDKKNKFTVQMDCHGGYSSEAATIAAFKWFTHVTHSKVFGFFITETKTGAVKAALNRRYVCEDGTRLHQKQADNYYAYTTLREQLVAEMKKSKFVATKAHGYSDFYLILGGTELTADEDDELEINGKITASKLKKAFSDMNKKKVLNRVLVSRFIAGIAA